MARHRNVRSMKYDEVDELGDDVFGHSVEDDYCISPSVEAQFLYDRSRNHQMSAFMHSQDEIVEEDEGEEEDSGGKGRERCDSTAYRPPPLPPLDEARLRSCLDEIRNVIGDATPESVLVEAILSSKFNVEKALDTVLTNTQDLPTPGAPKPQREKKERRRDPVPRQKLPEAVVLKVEPAVNVNIANGTVGPKVAEPEPKTLIVTPSAPIVKLVPAQEKTTQVTKGFDVPVDKLSADIKDNLNIEETASGKQSRSQSPSPEKVSQESDSSERTLENDAVIRTPAKSRDNRVDPTSEFARERGSTKPLLNLVVIGHVDAGKSTLMGHLLYELGQVNKKTMHKYELESRKLGKQSFLYAWVLDETGEERSRGITMDVGQSRFETPTKSVVLLDAPGHKDFIPNMITGASQADVAVLVVDATRGEFETGFESGGQTREHALLVRSLGVSQLAVIVNKLDTVSWSESRFQEIVSKLKSFLRQAGYRDSDITFVPCSGLTGENLTSTPKDEALISWYKGPTVLQVIDNFKSPERPVSKPFRLSVSDIFKGQGSGFCIAGRVETGMVQQGDKVQVQPQNETAVVKAISIDEFPAQSAFAGDHVSLTLSGIDIQNVSVGFIVCDPINPVPTTTRFEARIVIFNLTMPITKGFTVVLHHHSLAEQAIVYKLVAQLHKSSGEVIKRRPRCLLKNSSAVIELQTARPVCLERYRDVKELGRFMLRAAGTTIAAGLVTEIY